MGGRSKGTGKPGNAGEETGNGSVFTGNVFMFLTEENTRQDPLVCVCERRLVF